MAAPFIPAIEESNFNKNYVNEKEWKDAAQVKQVRSSLRDAEVQQQFKSYYLDKRTAQPQLGK